ncbi:MAG: tetratricopeptide repeat protein [Deltaproteobacteria bacterium]|nr:tetratricopeptide repeat protein [Deltaproteobacteria bacterium]
MAGKNSTSEVEILNPATFADADLSDWETNLGADIGDEEGNPFEEETAAAILPDGAIDALWPTAGPPPPPDDGWEEPLFASGAEADSDAAAEQLLENTSSGTDNMPFGSLGPRLGKNGELIEAGASEDVANTDNRPFESLVSDDEDADVFSDQTKVPGNSADLIAASIATGDVEIPKELVAATVVTGDVEIPPHLLAATIATGDVKVSPSAASKAVNAPPIVSAQPIAAPALATVGEPAEALKLDLLPLDHPVPVDADWLLSLEAFQRHYAKLAQAEHWRDLAATTGYALTHARYLSTAVRAGMLSNLARLYDTRLDDPIRAEQAWRTLVEQDVANKEARDALCAIYERRGDHAARVEVLARAAQQSWEPAERLALAEQAARIAEDDLGDVGQAISVWEALWQAGDAPQRVMRELAHAYRRGQRWEDLANLIEQRASTQDGSHRQLALRELIAVSLQLDTPDRAASTLQQLDDADPLVAYQRVEVHRRRKDWSAIAAIGNQIAKKTLLERTDLDLLRRVGDALWDAEQYDAAASAYGALLSDDPQDPQAAARQSEYLRRKQRYGALAEIIAARADSCEDAQGRLDGLREAAQIASKDPTATTLAIELWSSVSAIAPGDALPAQELQRLHEQGGDLPSAIAAVERQLRLVDRSAQRVPLLHQLARYAKETGDVGQAVERWQEVLALDPHDSAAFDALLKHYKSRADYTAIDTLLQDQLAAADEIEQAQRVARYAAHNIEEHIDDHAQAVTAWLRVLDYTPTDEQALAALERHYEALGQTHHQIAVLERRILCADPSTRTELARSVGRLWLDAGNPRAAAASFERVLSWSPNDESAATVLVDIYREAGERGRARSLLEQIGPNPEQPGEYVARHLAVLEGLEPLERMLQLRRLVLLVGVEAELLAQLERAAAEADAWEDYALLLVQLSARVEGEARAALISRLAATYESKLDSVQRAFLTRQSQLFSTTLGDAELGELRRLTAAAGRHEDMLALLERQADSAHPLEVRRQALVDRAQICEEQLQAPLRAFLEHRRRLELDPADQQAIGELERRAGEHNFWSHLDAAYAELAERSDDPQRRLELLRRRVDLAADRRQQPKQAFDLAATIYRLLPGDQALRRRIEQWADTLNQWPWLLPIFEANTDAADAEALANLADLYLEKNDDAERALELYCRSLILSPSTERIDSAERLAKRIAAESRLAMALRMAAATCQDSDIRAELLRRVARISDVIDEASQSVDAWRWIWRMRPDDRDSLDALISWCRRQERWSQLTDLLERRADLAESPPAEQALEIAHLAAEHLGDVERAVAAFESALASDSTADAALDGLASIADRINDPQLRERVLVLRLERADESQRPELRIAIAKAQREQPDGAMRAVATLAELVNSEGVDASVFDPLLDALERRGDHAGVLELLNSRISVIDRSDQLRSTYVRRGLDVARQHSSELDAQVVRRAYEHALADGCTAPAVIAEYTHLLCRCGAHLEVLKLQQDAQRQADSAIQPLWQHPLARLLRHHLDRSADARAIYQQLADQADEAAIIALAHEAFEAGELDAYVDLRIKQSTLLPSAEAALVLCHLAEVCESAGMPAERTVSLYREALVLDPANEPATAALRAVARQLKTRRPQASLVPEDAAGGQTNAERAQLLCDLANTAEGARAFEYLRRATAIDPTNERAWSGLSACYSAAGDTQQACRSALNAWRVHEYLTPQRVENAGREAAMLCALGDRARAADQPAAGEVFYRFAYQHDPTFAPAALEMGWQHVDVGQGALACVVLDRVDADQLRSEQRASLYVARGIAARQSGNLLQAGESFDRALDQRPLDGAALVAAAELMAEMQRFVPAIDYQLRALVAENAPAKRADFYFRLGSLWEEGLKAEDEATACYECAAAEGLQDATLSWKLLERYVADGNATAGLQIIEELSAGATKSAELATLWHMRGQLLEATEEHERQAIAAYDMALSYDPSRAAPRQALVALLTRCQEWSQVIELLEASAESGETPQRLAALERLAEIYGKHVERPEKAAECIRRAVAIKPTRPWVERLVELYRADGDHSPAYLDALGQLVSVGPPWIDPLTELGQSILEKQPARAWCLLSPLLGVGYVDRDLKSQLIAMRKDYEQPAPLSAGDADAPVYQLLHHPDAKGALADVIAEVSQRVGALREVPLNDPAASVVLVGSGTNHGSLFERVANAAGIDGARLYRAKDDEHPWLVSADSDGPIVVASTTVLQHLLHAEVAFFIAFAAEMARPEYRILATTSADLRDKVVPSLWNVLELGQVEGDPALETRLRDGLDDETRSRWRDRLAELADDDPRLLGQRLWHGIQQTALRVGLLAGPDLRQVMRALHRMSPEVAKPQVVSRSEDLDQQIAAVPWLAELIAFAASPSFALALRQAEPIDDE